jgi:hypothetical protein
MQLPSLPVRLLSTAEGDRKKTSLDHLYFLHSGACFAEHTSEYIGVHQASGKIPLLLLVLSTAVIASMP